MTKTQLIEEAAKKAGITKKDCTLALDAMIETVIQALETEEKVSVPGFGCFEVKHRAPRTGRDIHTGEKLEIPAARVPVFRPGTVLRQAVENSEV